MTKPAINRQAHAHTVGVRARAVIELLRIRIAWLVMAATAVGYFLATPAGAGFASTVVLAYALVGTALLATGANALNQYVEAEHDARMTRTKDRPIPSGRLGRGEVLVIGMMTGLGGIAWLGATVNLLSAIVGAVTLGGYVLLYTPMKRVSWHSVLIGAVPGALPPVIGWAAATGTLAPEAGLLFLIVFLWQLPHFDAIAWLHRDDYAAAGFPMLSVLDRSGTRLFRHMLFTTVLLVLASLLAGPCGMAGGVYMVGAILLGTAFGAFGVILARAKTIATARMHLMASIVYLPLLLGLLMFDRLG